MGPAARAQPAAARRGVRARLRERPLEAPEIEPVRRAVAQVLTGHEPFPAAVVDRWWNLVAANRHLALFLEGVASHLLDIANVLSVSLHPEGMAPRIVNLAEWRAHLLDRLRREVAATGDERLAALLVDEGYRAAGESAPRGAGRDRRPAVRRDDGQELSFFSTVATFGTAMDVTVAELSIEAFFPADAVTARFLAAITHEVIDTLPLGGTMCP